MFGLTTIVRDPKELRVSPEKVDALHAAAFLLLVDADAALPVVALLVCTGGASLIGGSEGVEFQRCKVEAERAVDRRQNIFYCYKRVVRCIDFNCPGEAR